MANNLRISFADYLYNRLPKLYRTHDTEQILRRFIETFAEGGFDPLLQETVDMMNLLDVDKCPSEFLPLLCQMYGFEYTVEIPELFIRRLLKHIIELYKRKGTKSVVKFIARELTGFDSEIIENKDFDEELIELTHWDIRFEHYRNFVLKLNAPYEDSSLYNKEDVVKKLLTDFLPTNSQVFVITVYWFQEDSEIVAKSVDDYLKEFVNDYNEEVATIKRLMEDISYKIKDNLYDYIYTFIGEEESITNDSVRLITNVLLRILDVVSINEGLENHQRNVIEARETSSNLVLDGEMTKSSESFEESLTRLKHKLNEEQEQIESSTLTQMEETTKSRDTYSFEPRPTESLERGIKDIVSDYNSEDLEVGRIFHNSCDIINTNHEETYETPYQEVNSENCLLNLSTPLITNALVNWDIVHEVGKPDKFILL